MANQKKNHLLESVPIPPAWLLLLLAVFFYVTLNTKGDVGQVIALPVSLVFLLISLSRLITDVRFAGIAHPIQARLFQSKADKKQYSSDGSHVSQANQSQGQGEGDAIQEEYQEALDKLQRKRDEEAAAVLEKIGSSTLESLESEHILRREKKKAGEGKSEKENNEKSSSSVTLEPDILKALSNDRFEATVAAYYNCKGYHAGVSKVAGAVELVLRRKEMSKSKSIVSPSCIVHIRAGKEGNTESRFVRILHDKRLEDGVKSALIISRSTFTKGAVEFAEGYKILLLDSRRLAKVINELPEEQIEKIKAVALK